jgi:nucleoside-diphosphate-sugar epimerase
MSQQGNRHSALRTLAQNVQGAYLVLDGAGRAGVRCAVAASSVAAYGYAWADRDLSPPYVPIDEDQSSSSATETDWRPAWRRSVRTSPLTGGSCGHGSTPGTRPKPCTPS